MQNAMKIREIKTFTIHKSQTVTLVHKNQQYALLVPNSQRHKQFDVVNHKWPNYLVNLPSVF